MTLKVRYQFAWFQRYPSFSKWYRLTSIALQLLLCAMFLLSVEAYRTMAQMQAETDAEANRYLKQLIAEKTFNSALLLEKKQPQLKPYHEPDPTELPIQ